MLHLVCQAHAQGQQRPTIPSLLTDTAHTVLHTITANSEVVDQGAVLRVSVCPLVGAHIDCMRVTNGNMPIELCFWHHLHRRLEAKRIRPLPHELPLCACSVPSDEASGPVNVLIMHTVCVSISELTMPSLVTMEADGLVI